MLREFAALSEDALVPIPDHLSYEEAATLPCAGVTAWNALTGGRPLQAGETVLTLGSGAVSLFAIQFAKLFGAQVIATTSSEAKAARLSALGVDAVVNYRTEADWPAAVRRMTAERGVDHVVEVGGFGTMEGSFRATAVGGEIAWIGSLAGGAPAVNLGLLFNAVATLPVVAVGSRSQLSAMCRAIALHRLRPVIDRVFPFDDAPAAFAYYAAGHQFGKVVIAIDG
jgi:NADPH:quinone reductase-like Zn-dependent oxidoreductase